VKASVSELELVLALERGMVSVSEWALESGPAPVRAKATVQKVTNRT